MRRRILWGSLVAALLVVLVHPVRAQPLTIEGTVTDARSGEPLPQANLRVEGTYRGTITSAQGRYTLAIDSLPATVVVRYVGYATERFRVTPSSGRQQNVALSPSRVALNEVVVTGQRNPGRAIMRKVIEQKQTWWDSLQTYQVDAYSRYTLSNDTSIVSIYESQSRAFWDRGRGTREVVQARRQTANLRMMDAALPAASAVLNLYADNVTVAGSELMGVTHPDALDRYAFTLDTTRVLDGKRVFDIQVEPKRRVTAAFEGRVLVLDSTFAMVEANLQPASSLRLPRVLKNRSIAFEQQFSNFGGPFWLPVDFRARRSVEVELSIFLQFPRIHLKQVTRLSDYEVNVPVPDSLYVPEQDNVIEGPRVAEVQTVGNDSLSAGPFVPLTDAEQQAYARPDSAVTFASAFGPDGLIGGLLDLRSDGGGLSIGGDAGEGRKASAADSSEAGGLIEAVEVGLPMPSLRYNRVEGAHVGGRLGIEVAGAVDFEVRGGHNFGREGATLWSYGGRVEMPVGVGGIDRVSASYQYGIEPRYTSEVRLFPPLTRGVNSLWTLAGQPDYYDYFGTERVRVELMGREIAGITPRLQFRTERHFATTGVSDYTLLGRNTVLGRHVQQPPNPPINPGRLNALHLALRWGDDPPILGVLPVNRVQLAAEHSGGWLGSDFAFTRLEATVDARVETFFRRRLLPMTLDLRLDAGTALGTVPLQRFGVVEASPLPYAPFGALRTLDDRPYQGVHHTALYWEHNLRTVPFQWLGLYGVADRHIELIVHGGHARTWLGAERDQSLRRRGISLRQSARFHHEVGISVNGLLKDLLRVDVTARLDEPAVSVGVGLLRFL